MQPDTVIISTVNETVYICYIRSVQHTALKNRRAFNKRQQTTMTYSGRKSTQIVKWCMYFQMSYCSHKLTTDYHRTALQTEAWCWWRQHVLKWYDLTFMLSSVCGVTFNNVILILYICCMLLVTCIVQFGVGCCNG